MAKIDLEAVEELTVRLEWVEMALSGDKDNMGLIDRLGSLFTVGDSSIDDGVLLKLDKTLQDAQTLSKQIASLEQTLSKPINTEQADQIELAVSSSIDKGSESLKAELVDINKASHLAAERITSSASQAEVSLRTASNQLAAAEDSLHQLLPQVTQQLKAVLLEAEGAIGSEKALSELKVKIEGLVKELVVDAKAESLKQEWGGILDVFIKELNASFIRQSEAIEEIVIDTQAENLERVKKLIDHRAPSDVIIKLFEDLDASQSENVMLRKKLAKAGVSVKSKSLLPTATETQKVAVCAAVISGVGVFLGAAGMWGLLIGFG